jgi:hypothetical protein
MAKYTKVTVVLIENSPRGNRRQFDGQSVEIDREPTVTQMSVDGQLSIGELPTHVLWKEGRASHFQHVTDVRITTLDDRIIVEGTLNRTFNWPRDSTEASPSIYFEVRRMVCTRCGIIGADARPNWREQPQRESLTGVQWR